ncbi:MAG: hypothetical protein K8H88_29560 [Sandaracinaceae bacterium]|nr:hypothetical protein [Sandaracinaceae bacterium]
MSKPTFWDFLARSTDELVAMGVVRARVVDERFAATGHVRPISWPWIKTFGSWGGVEPVDVIADRAGVEIPQVRDYTKGRGLKHATRHVHRSHAELAVALWCDRTRSPEESCRRLGVFPGERRLLCAAAQVLIDNIDGGIEVILRWPLRELDARFADLNVRLTPPPMVLHGQALSDADAVAHRDALLRRVKGAA